MIRSKNVIVFDLDNCIAEDASRLHLIPPENAAGCGAGESAQARWHAYHLASVEATAHHQAEVLAAALDLPPSGVLVYLTARPCAYSAITLEWLFRNGYLACGNWQLLMRPNHCLAPSPEMKLEQLSAWLENQEMTFDNVKLLHDDRIDVLRAFQAQNVPTKHLFIENR